MAKILLSAFTDEYNRDVDTQINLCKEQGLAYFEPRFVGDKNIADLTAQEAKELKLKLGDIKVSSIGSPLGKINLADDFEAHLEKAKRVFDTANILDTENIRMFSFYLHQGKSREECREEVLDKLGRMLKVAKEFGVTLCHENEGEIYGESPEQCLDILQAFGGELKAVFDMGNFVLGGYDPYNVGYPMLKDYIKYFHIKDALAAGAVVPPGLGEGKVKELLTDYKNDFGKDFIVTLEPHLQTFDGLNALVVPGGGKPFDNPYKYETQEAAFLDALTKMKAILAKI